MNVEICLQCRTKYEAAKRDLEYYKKQIDYYRRSCFRIEKENRRLKEELAGKRGKR
jgi:hypothetical protein